MHSQKGGAVNQPAFLCCQNNQSINKKLWPSFNVIFSLHYSFNIFDNPNVLFVIKKHKLCFVNMLYKILGQKSRSENGMRKTWRSTILHLVIQVVIKNKPFIISYFHDKCSDKLLSCVQPTEMHFVTTTRLNHLHIPSVRSSTRTTSFPKILPLFFSSSQKSVFILCILMNLSYYFSFLH